MNKQYSLFSDTENTKEKNKFAVGHGLILELREGYPKSALLFVRGVMIKKINLSDKIRKKIFIIEALELGAQKSRLAKALNISRQTIDNYQGIMKQFGLEGFVQGYSLADSKSKQRQRKIHNKNNRRIAGNRAKQLSEIRRKVKDQLENQYRQLPFNFGYDTDEPAVEAAEQPFCEQHQWEATRYAGVFVYLIALITKWRWLQLVMGYFGCSYKIFMIFLLMTAQEISSIEQVKNVRSREAGKLLGIKRLPSKPKIWECFYSASNKGLSCFLLSDYFRYQIKVGLVGLYLWFTDGHLLPYTGKEPFHYSYNTQRGIAVPGRTNMVTCDSTGRIIDFEIQEGKGDMKAYIISLWEKWRRDLPACPIMVFDREGYDAGFFSKLVLGGIAFVTWQKNVDAKEMAAIDDKKYKEQFEFNGKSYAVFEDEKIITYLPGQDSDIGKHCFKLRHLFIWNKSSKRRTCGVAWTGDIEISTVECCRAILSRWGASENTFKHTLERHPLHYHPGFKLIESENQEIKNPSIKKKDKLIKTYKTKVGKLYKKLADSKDVLNKDGSPRQNSVKERIKKEIQKHEFKLKILKQEKKEIPERINVSSLENYK
ncbi:MAG: hypothetical protein KAR17_04120, partial [Cyclobacteriaceae bacterium]|nr:hypothetical protein [Cyclobacteriaceae bacterium]